MYRQLQPRLRKAEAFICMKVLIPVSYTHLKGLDTLLGEKGTGLSEGQMQRIAIARAVFSEHPILILDEATSALDKTTAIKLLKNLRKMTDRTVLLVTHRIEQIEIFDKTVSFFKEGSWQISVTDKKEE